MLDAEAEESLATLTEQGADALKARWRGGDAERSGPGLSLEARRAADRLSGALVLLTQSDEGAAALRARLSDAAVGPILFEWCAASTWRRDARLAPVLRAVANHPGFVDRIPAVARSRVVQGPFLDALGCAPLLGDGTALGAAENAEARARLEILFWEAGASALELPEIGRWLWSSRETFEVVIHGPARGALRGRVLAARCLEVGVRGIPDDASPELVGTTLGVLQPLLLHPEPLVWVHAARALGRLTGRLQELEGTLLDWVVHESPVLRQRAMTAVASLPAERLTFLLASQLSRVLESQQEEPWVLAAVAAATPYLFFEREDLWDRLASRILAGEGGAISARALARGLATLWRRGVKGRETEVPLRALRESARAARPSSLDDGRRWLEVIAATDVVDGAERDPLDLELGLENLVRVAAQYDDEEADSRAARFASSLGSAFADARTVALGRGRIRHRAAAINAVEGCSRAFALRLWGPLLATHHDTADPVEEPDLRETWAAIARAPAEILDLLRERRADSGAPHEDDVPLEVLAVRLGGYALDACGEDGDLGRGRGPTAHDTCLWLRKLVGLDGSTREPPAALKTALSMLLWRLVDTTRGTALGEVDDVRWLGPFAAWWALVIDRPAMLAQLGTALPMMSSEALASCCGEAEALRTTVSSGQADGDWGAAAANALARLHADDTELAHALGALARALDAFKVAAGPRPALDALCTALVLAGDRLQAALADPVKGLHPASDDHGALEENAQRVAALVARAIRTRDPSKLDVWFASLGPVVSALLETAVRGAMDRTPPPPPTRKEEPKVVEGYELVKQLGEGGIGKVWLVRKPGADRLFVLKVPKADALANASETERAGILASFIEEAKALAGLYHPNVANIIDRGVSGDVPFLVLEYLIGADLKHYAAARPMTLFELRQVVLDACAGLAALHGAGLVHRDLKPANVWLRLPLARGEAFDPQKHRDPAIIAPLSSVVIDFGMVRASRVTPDAAGRFVAGTAGYIAPEQVLDPVDLDPRSDVYALAGTVYNVTTGRAFFDDIENPRDRILAHMRRDPLEDAERLRPFPASIAKLLRAATAQSPDDRPTPLEFGKAFVDAI